MNAPFSPDKFLIETATRDLRPFVPAHQLRTLLRMARESEEREFFITRMVEMAALVAAMPKTYEQDGKGDEAMAHLHYFSPSGDWWITEKDIDTDGEGQIQAFGMATINGCTPELGYISIAELCQSYKVELDLHFTPRTIGTIRKERARG
jgi:hypothetical protein